MVRKEWRRILGSQIMTACEEMWALVNKVDKEEDVTQAMREEWYSRWRIMPQRAHFAGAEYLAIDKVPMRSRFGKKKPDQLHRATALPANLSTMGCEY